MTAGRPAPPFPRCVYCGHRATMGRTCRSHADLLAREPELTVARERETRREVRA